MTSRPPLINPKRVMAADCEAVNERTAICLAAGVFTGVLYAWSGIVNIRSDSPALLLDDVVRQLSPVTEDA